MTGDNNVTGYNHYLFHPALIMVLVFGAFLCYFAACALVFAYNSIKTPGKIRQFMDSITPEDRLRYAMIAVTFFLLIFAFYLAAFHPNLMAGLIIFSACIFAAYFLFQWHMGKQMALRLDQSVFFAGQNISGELIYLGNERKARGVQIIFCGVQHQGKKEIVLCEQKHTIMPARVIRKGESFRFSIPMPTVVNDTLDALPGPYMPRWSVRAFLDLPNEIDISRSVEVKIAKGKKGKDD